MKQDGGYTTWILLLPKPKRSKDGFRTTTCGVTMCSTARAFRKAKSTIAYRAIIGNIEKCVQRQESHNFVDLAVSSRLLGTPNIRYSERSMEICSAHHRENLSFNPSYILKSAPLIMHTGGDKDQRRGKSTHTPILPT